MTKQKSKNPVYTAHDQLIAALEFYADADTWSAVSLHSTSRLADDFSPTDKNTRELLRRTNEPGRRAREALEAWKRVVREP